MLDVLIVLLVVFIVLPLVEISVIVRVADAIGGWNTIGLLVAVSITGAYLVRHEGWVVFRRVTEQLDRGNLPAREMLDGALVLAGGVLMVTPGFVTDAMGLLLVFPPTRALARSVLITRLRNRIGIITPPRRGGRHDGWGGDGGDGGDGGGVIDV